MTSLSCYYDITTLISSRKCSADPLSDTRSPKNVLEETKVAESYIITTITLLLDNDFRFFEKISWRSGNNDIVTSLIRYIPLRDVVITTYRISVFREHFLVILLINDDLIKKLYIPSLRNT